MPLFNQMFGKPQMAGIEGFNLGLYAERFHLIGHFDKHRCAVRHDVVAMSEIHRAAIQRANFRQAVSDMGKALGGTGHVGANRIGRQGCFHPAQNQIAAHAGCQIQHHINVSIADALGHFAEQRRIA